MSSMIDLGNGQLQLPFGVLSGVTSMERRANGSLKSVTLNEKNVILTHAGDLYVAHTQTPRRKHKPSVEFFENGLTKSVSLEEQQDVLTPIGELPAELVTFYESGELHRVFPVDGQISGFWSEEEERAMNIPLTFDLGFAIFTAMLSSISFYQSGSIQSITLYPDEVITLDTPLGVFTARHGLSLYESGSLRSFEPASPVNLQTPVGRIAAFDPLSNGVNADTGSVLFTPDGDLMRVSTIANRVMVQTGGGQTLWHTPTRIPHPCSDEEPWYQPLQLAFDTETVTITDGAAHPYRTAECHFHVSAFSDGSTMGCSPADCASCSLCSH